ncbi:acetyltransferase [Rheinheimera muenzenbergensis]|uniref:Acetyltransferase n=1 Tax=Rheinheimera muenzenbergensis TaxID=1193628 RepID=A0ABU8C238_9GAMM
MQTKHLILLGAGGHAKVLLSILVKQQTVLSGVCALQPPQSAIFASIPFLGDDSAVLQYPPEQTLLINGVGALPGNSARNEIFNRFSALGYRFASVISSDALIDPHCTLGQGVQIMPGVIINADANIADNVIINTGALVEHDCVLERHTIVSPGAILCGGVCCGENSYIGAGATVIQGLKLGNNTTVAAGSTVVRNLLDNQKIYGAKSVIKIE